MKIVRIIARLNVGGPARHVVWLTAGLQGEEYDSVLVAGVVPSGEDDMGYFAREQGVEPLIIPQMSREISPKDVVTIWKLYRLFVRERPDVVHTHTAKAGTVGRVAGLFYRWLTFRTLVGRPRRCRFVHTYHGHVFHSYYGAFKTRVFIGVERILALLATDKIITISPQQRREINEGFGVGRREQFAVVPLGLDTAVFADWRKRRETMRAEFGAASEDVLVGIVGRLTEIKNHSLFLEAASLYKQKLDTEKSGRRVRFVIIGDGNLRAGLEKRAGEMGLRDDVIFTGSRTDPENFYPALDIVALTSLNEGTPLTLIEAMVNERPVIATEVGGVVDLLGEAAVSQSNSGAPYKLRERGVLVPTNDAAAFAEALGYLIENEPLRRELGERGRRFVEQNYSKERLLADVGNLYHELLKDRQRESGVWQLAAADKRSADSRLPAADTRPD